jgi:DUF4097 and DUF4098 domain-containing protein YvlB
MKLWIRIALLCILAIVLQGCFAASPRAKATRTSTAVHIANTALNVQSRNGFIEVSADSKLKEVEIVADITCVGDSQSDAEQRLEKATIDISRDTTGALTVKPIFPIAPRGDDGANIAVRIPDTKSVVIKTSNGHVTVNATAGGLTITTSNGAVKVTDHRGSAKIETSNGPVTVRKLGGGLTVITSNGGVNATEIGGPADIRTSNGRVALAILPDQAGPISVRSSNGSISATVGKAFASVIRLETSNGSIRVKDPANRAPSKQLQKRAGTITVGKGGSESTLVTSNGSIEIVIE